MSDQIRISGKNLGAVALPNFCPRCYWIKLKLGDKLPYQIFPGIFSSIDSYTKKIVHSWFDKKNQQPNWLNSLGKFKGYINPPTFHKFNTIVDEFNILLTGSPDGVLLFEDDSYAIVDYKTAKYTGAQDSLFPMYETQLNAYTFIANALNYPRINKLALIYTEPITDGEKLSLEENFLDYGFAMEFNAQIVGVKINQDLLNPLFEKVRQIFEMNQPPNSAFGCKDCPKVDNLVSIFN